MKNKLYEVCIFDDMDEIRYLTVSGKTEYELKQFIDKSSSEYDCYMGCVITEIKEVDGYKIKLEKITNER